MPDDPRLDAALERAAQAAAHKRLTDRLNQFAKILLEHAAGDPKQAQRLLDQIPLIASDDEGIFETWRYRIVLKAIKGEAGDA